MLSKAWKKNLFSTLGTGRIYSNCFWWENNFGICRNYFANSLLRQIAVENWRWNALQNQLQHLFVSYKFAISTNLYAFCRQYTSYSDHLHYITLWLLCTPLVYCSQAIKCLLVTYDYQYLVFKYWNLHRIDLPAYLLSTVYLLTNLLC